MIDWSRVAGLRDDVGEEDFDEVVELFLEEVDEVITRLRDALDTTTLEGDLHFLKGSAMGLGFSAFSAQCQTGETLCAEGRAGELDLQTLLTTYSDSRRVFLEEMPTALAG